MGFLSRILRIIRQLSFTKLVTVFRFVELELICIIINACIYLEENF